MNKTVAEYVQQRDQQNAKSFKSDEYYYGSVILFGIGGAAALFALGAYTWSVSVTFVGMLSVLGLCYLGLSAFAAFSLKTHRRLYGHYYGRSSS